MDLESGTSFAGFFNFWEMTTVGISRLLIGASSILAVVAAEVGATVVWTATTGAETDAAVGSGAAPSVTTSSSNR